jgi:hypothetical protein
MGDDEGRKSAARWRDRRAKKSHVVRVAGKCVKSDIVRLCFYRPFPVIVRFR